VKFFAVFTIVKWKFIKLSLLLSCHWDYILHWYNYYNSI